jgi:branched-chain amino acid transport system permease protein
MFGRGTRERSAAIAVGVGVVVFVVLRFVLPGSPGSGRGTPVAILFQGLVTGALSGLIAIGLVLIYRTARIINFAQAAIGTVGAIFAYNMAIVYHVPYGVAFAGGVVVCCLAMVLIELLLIRRFFEAPRLVMTIVTIGLAALFATRAAPIVGSFPIWGDQRDLATRLGSTPLVPVKSMRFFLGKVAIPFGFPHVLTLIMAAVVLAALGAFLRFTRLGTAVRASSENTERAELLGINVRALSTVIWVIAAALSAIAITLQGTVAKNFGVASAGAFDALIAALAAAVIARMRSFSIAMYAAVLIAIVQNAINWSYRSQGNLVDASLVLVVAGGLLLQRRSSGRTEEVSAWEATEEVRPIPRELLDVGGVRTWRLAAVVVGAVFIVLFPWTTNAGVVNSGSLAAIIAMVILSITVLTGWAGQVSLAQFAFVGIGAVVGGALTSRAGWSFWEALPVTAIVTMVVAVIVGIPALRIRGLYLAVLTFAFASSVSILLFSDKYFGWLQPQNIRRPTLLLLDFEDERSMYYLCVVFLALTVLLLVTLRRSRPGRILIALRENESDLQAFGINVVRTKLTAFALSGFICGVAGMLYAHHQRAVGQQAFLPQASIDVFVFAVIGGIGSLSGALIGGGLYIASTLYSRGNNVVAFFLDPAFVLLAVLYILPGGAASGVYKLRDSLLRIVAQRRQIVVPALFADIDPAVLAKQLIPLAEREERTGIGALRDARYRLDSDLYKEAEVDLGEGARDEREVLGAVAERVGGVE